MTLQAFKTNSGINCKSISMVTHINFLRSKINGYPEASGGQYKQPQSLTYRKNPSFLFFYCSCIQNKLEIVTKKFRNKCYTNKCLAKMTNDFGIILFLIFSWAFFWQVFHKCVKYISNSVKKRTWWALQIFVKEYKFMRLIW